MVSEISIQTALMLSEISFHAVLNADKDLNPTVLNDTTDFAPNCTQACYQIIRKSIPSSL